MSLLEIHCTENSSNGGMERRKASWFCHAPFFYIRRLPSALPLQYKEEWWATHGWIVCVLCHYHPKPAPRAFARFGLPQVFQHHCYLIPLSPTKSSLTALPLSVSSNVASATCGIVGPSHWHSSSTYLHTLSECLLCLL